VGAHSSGTIRILRLALPVALQSLLMSALSLTDQLMVGQLGDDAVATAGISTQLTSLISVVITGVIAAIGAYTAQFWAKKDIPSTTGAFRLSFTIAQGITIPASLVGIIFPNVLMAIFTADQTLIGVGSSYVRLIATAFLPAASVIAASGTLRAMGKMKLPLYASIVAIIINIALDWILMFGNLGAPRLGLIGGGIGTLTARIIEALILLIAVYRILGKPKRYTSLARSLRRRVIATVLPMVANELVWVLSENTYAAIYGHMQTTALVAMTMTYPLQGLVMGLFSGVSAAATPLLGQSLGIGQRERAQADAHRLLRLALLISLGVAALVFVFAGPYVTLYRSSPAAQAASVNCLIVFACFLMVKVQNLVFYGGILPTGGDTRYLFVTSSLATWLVGVPLAFISAFVLNYPIWAVYALLSVEEILRFLIAFQRVRSRKWMRISIADPDTDSTTVGSG